MSRTAVSLTMASERLADLLRMSESLTIRSLPLKAKAVEGLSGGAPALGRSRGDWGRQPHARRPKRPPLHWSR
jgi:hypothetical protein